MTREKFEDLFDIEKRPGAGLALCGAYIAMIAAMRVLTRGLFPVRFEWGRLAQAIAILACVAVSGELLLSPSGAGGMSSFSSTN